MTQTEMERELAEVTGESLGTIRRRGFQLVEPPVSVSDPQFVDWDTLHQDRVAVLPQRSRSRRLLAAC